MNEVSSLPKLGSDQHSSTAGPLANYQGSISEQLMRIIGRLQYSVRIVADKTMEKLSARMAEYRKKYDDSCSRSKAIIESISTTFDSFDDLRQQLKINGDNILVELESLKKDSFLIYNESINEIKPFVDHAYMISKEILPQVPPNIAERLPAEISRLNTNFLKTKQDLTKVLFQVEANTRNSIQNNIIEFEKVKDKWKNHRFSNLVTKAKNQLDPTKFVDFGPLYTDFHKEQANFTLCFRKLLTNVTLLLPPDNFSEMDYEEWSKEVDEVIECHNNFIKTFEAKFIEVVTTQMNINSDLINQLEKELVELRNENEANFALSEIYPLFKATQKLNNTLLDKIQKYWEHRKSCIQKAFDSIRTFLKPLVELTHKFSNEMNKFKEKEQNKIDKLKEKSNETLESLETKLSNAKKSIATSVTEKNIEIQVRQCKKILSQIDDEYHQIYQQLISIYDGYPTSVNDLFNEIEEEVIEHLQLKKVEGIILPSSRLNDSRNSTKRPPVRKKINQSPTKTKTIVVEGAKFEQEEPIVIIPVFDDFIDDPVLPQVSSKDKKQQRKKPGPPKKITSKGSRGSLRKDDCEDIVMPEFVLVDVIPKVDDMISVYVYAPAPEEIAEWKDEILIRVMQYIYSDFKAALNWANDEKRRDDLANELNERMRVHMPRMSSIELNIAETRAFKIQSRQVQLDSFLKRQSSHFNSSFTNIQGTLTKLYDKINNECENLRKFIDDLSSVKSSQGFSVLNQNKTIAEHKFNAHFEDYCKQQIKEIDDFINYFVQSNERYMETVVMKDDSYSEEEREATTTTFQKMNEQINLLQANLKNTAEQNKEKVETNKNQILEEYETASPNHMADVAFIENIATLSQEYKHKYESLLFQNHAMERELQHAIDVASDSGKGNRKDHQKIIDTIFVSMEELRQKLIYRGIYLKQLKSKMSSDKINLITNLGPASIFDTTALLSESGTSSKKVSRPTSKHGNNESGRKSRSKSSKSGKRPLQGKKSMNQIIVPVSEKKSTNPATFKGKLETLRQNFLKSAVILISDYYGTFKTRKFPITRTEQIPEGQQEFVDKMSETWGNTISSVKSVLKKSNAAYRLHVVSSTEVIRILETIIYEVISDYYDSESEEMKIKIKETFEKDFSSLLNERNSNRSRMNPKIADNNCAQEFDDLVLEEEERNKRELKRIADFAYQMIECEKNAMNNFMVHLPPIVQCNLNLLDKFVIAEDLTTGKLENVPRKTMKEMLKDKQRLSGQNLNSSNRPFKQREWPELNVIMKPILNIQNNFPDISGNEDQPTPQETRRSSGKRKRRLEKNEIKAQASLKQLETLENVPTGIVSLETPIHRATIIARNECYNNYEKRLSERLNNLKNYVNQLETANKTNYAFWLQTVHELKPKYEFPENPSRPNSKK
ncbi:hypothetical protein TRFO_24984 [Tritrichomonas foetus]|uniref:DUF4456 domain-containing protein n=1 Tax=Tritrichomonas foetus TaxID=1144522 RepID=A0A1J4K6S2_9EUKA|nr:hypothetical protein TRFO_24984 [Tritrichomonas foetus]|eukprot:OHT06883.1 hypothetical protein TRFO_24984 [Tritrichomonas foetus]